MVPISPVIIDLVFQRKIKETKKIKYTEPLITYTRSLNLNKKLFYSPYCF